MYSEVFKKIHNNSDWMTAYYTHFQALRDIENYLKEILQPDWEIKAFNNREFECEENIYELFLLILAKKVIKNKDLLSFYAIIFECIRRMGCGIDAAVDDENKKLVPFERENHAYVTNGFLAYGVYEKVIFKACLDFMDFGLLNTEDCDCVINSLMSVLKPKFEEEQIQEAYSGENYPTVFECYNFHIINRNSHLMAAQLEMLIAMGQAETDKCIDFFKAIRFLSKSIGIVDDIDDFYEDIFEGGINVIISLMLNEHQVKYSQLHDLRKYGGFDDTGAFIPCVEEAASEVHKNLADSFSIIKSCYPEIYKDTKYILGVSTSIKLQKILEKHKI